MILRMRNNNKIKSFPPVTGKNPEILILGSMPGQESLRQQQYYAYNRNSFWKIMGEIFDFNPELPYEQRLEALKKNKVALWDTAMTCTRRSSADSEIRNTVPNDIPSLLKKNPGIKKILFNGKTAYNLFVKNFDTSVYAGLVLEIMPSTSPANAILNFERKLAVWRKHLQPSDYV